MGCGKVGIMGLPTFTEVAWVLSFHSMEVINFLSGKLLRSFLKVSNRICGEEIVVGIPFLPTCVHCGQCITGRSTAILRLMCPITSGMFIQERARTGNVHSIRKIWNVWWKNFRNDCVRKIKSCSVRVRYSFWCFYFVEFRLWTLPIWKSTIWMETQSLTVVERPVDYWP